MKLLLFAVFAAFLSSTFGKSVVKLDDFNYEELTKDKILFIKFYAPWCGHCKAMANSWTKLSQHIDDENVVIGEVDCTAEDSEDICDYHEIDGYPTLKYGESGGYLWEYYEGQIFPQLYEFAKENLKLTCSPNNVNLCDKKQKTVLDKFMTKTIEDLSAALDAIEDSISNDEESDEIDESLDIKYQDMKNRSIKKKLKIRNDADYELVKQILEIRTEHGFKLTEKL